jgi:hypothetical protein
MAETLTTPDGTPGADVPEGATDPLLDLLLWHWLRIAAAAWEGYQTRGRGAVVMLIQGGRTGFSYRRGAPCPCHARWVEAYDPNEQVVVVLRRDGAKAESVHILGGWPSPPAALDAAGAEIFEAVVH